MTYLLLGIGIAVLASLHAFFLSRALLNRMEQDARRRERRRS
jgi:hypothetical protein